MTRILWGSPNERHEAREQLKTANEYINTHINSTDGYPNGQDCIPVENSFQVGEQLALAVRDAVTFRSTARFEDVRDFISELIENFFYPSDWRVQRFIFEQKVANQLSNSLSSAISYRVWWDNADASSEPDEI
jgi:hypothetical protein